MTRKVHCSLLNRGSRWPGKTALSRGVGTADLSQCMQRCLATMAGKEVGDDYQ